MIVTILNTVRNDISLLYYVCSGSSGILKKMYIAILGRQPTLGIAELERVFGSDNVTPLKSGAALLDVDESSIDLKRLGGTIKIAKLLTTLDTPNWRDVRRYLIDTIPKHTQYIPEGKFTLGLSSYGVKADIKEIKATALELKKIIKQTGKSVRIVPNKTPALNSAQILHNKLTTANGWELIVVQNGKKTMLGQTIAEQDIEAYTKRDQERPKRDAFVGMLPPKLAQIIVNLAVGSANQSMRVLDPFCGTGVILQEAALMGHAVYGTDLSEKMIRYSRDNLNWLQDSHLIRFDWYLHEGDAMTTDWQSPIDAVAAEAYLGQPFSAPPSPAKLAEVRRNCDHIIADFLKNIAPQLQPGTPLCVAVPAWRSKDGSFTHLPVINQVDSLGFKKVQLKYSSGPLLYYREDQVVARELLVLIKK